MSSLIVIRIVPQTPVEAEEFTSYLNPSNPSGPSLGPLQIKAFDLSFSSVDNQPPGQPVGTAVYAAPSKPPSRTAQSPLPALPATAAQYSAGTGIVQQYDYVPATMSESDYYQLESVATAIIEVVAPTNFENLRLEVQWGSDPGATTIPIALDFYDVAVVPGPAPDPNAWDALSPSLYIQLPAPPGAANPFALQLPTDGTPPAFDTLLKAVQTVLLQGDPGTANTTATTADAPAGSVNLQFAAPPTGISVGMIVGGTNIPGGTSVAAVSPTGLVTLSQEVSADVPNGTVITFNDLGILTLDQCRNIAYEIVWSQQPPVPTPPDPINNPIEDLYTKPTNSGTLMSNGSPNTNEGERQQFEAQLKSYYAVADINADRLTTFVYALSAAVACEQMSLAATQALLEFPVDPGQASAAPLSETGVILTGISAVDPPTNFGVPAAYFYALALMMPAQITAQQRYQMATSDKLTRLLTDLTTAINAGTISDSEEFVTTDFKTAAPASINAAQAARRITALGIPAGSSTPLAPLGSIALLTSADDPSGSTLSFSSTAGVQTGMLVSGTNIAANTKVSAVFSASVTVSRPILGDLPAGSSIIFAPDPLTPAYPPGLQSLIQSWLAYPQAAQGTPSSQTYAPTDDATKFWPGAANTQPGAFLSLVLSSLTQGYIIPAPPAPFNVALGDKITEKWALSTVTNLAAVTVEQWTDFFQPNPTWLPPFTQPGSTTARIAAFISYVQKFFVLGTSALPSSISGGTPTGLPLLQAPSSDWLAACLSSYEASTGGAYTFGSGFDLASLKAAAVNVFPGDQPAQDWVVDALVTIDALYGVMKPVLPSPALPPADAPGFEFSVVEALYARGFTSAADITDLSSSDFEQALTGTVAYDLAGSIYTSASAIAKQNPATPPAGGFQPVNPDGSLTNCIPPPWLSPLGPVAYLSEMLQVSENSTCEKPLTSSITLPATADTLAGNNTLTFSSTAGVTAGMFVSGTNIPSDTTVSAVTPISVTLSQPVSGYVPAGSGITFATAITLESVIARRRGPVGNLAATCANCETPLPLIDIVNECLEFLGAAAHPVNGTVYDTSTDAVAGHALCHEEACPDKEEKPPCNDPARFFATLPEYSTPATPVVANSAVEPLVYDKLKTDFSSCHLPYSQALDVSRTYLRHIRTCRFEEMRTFRKCITEFVLDPDNEPAEFQSYLWRYPVRIDTAIEYLGITPEEYTFLFGGTGPRPCATPKDRPRGDAPAVNAPPASTGDTPAPPELDGLQATASGTLAGWQLYGFDSPGDNDPWTSVVIKLPEFLERTCLSYCEFFELWQAGFVRFRNGDDREGLFPECEPCCLDRIWLQFPDERELEQDLLKLAVFIRLWRKLKESRCFCYSCAQLRDICDVLHLFNGSTINPDFIRQLAAFQMLVDHFRMELLDPGDKTPAAAIDADRTHLLALWVGPAAAKYAWAVSQLIARIEPYARQRHKCGRRSPEFVKLLASNLDPLSQLAGFDLTSANWHALPTHTLRFAEVLAKIYASDFSIGEILFLFTAGDHLDGDDPFPLQEENEALDLPLGLPDDEPKFSLWHLRRKLMEVQVTDGDLHEWHWKRIEAALQNDFDFALSDILAIGQHFFPGVLEEAGYQVDSSSRRYFSSLSPADTSPQMWNIPADGPFQYDPGAQQLWTRLPLTDEAVIAKLAHVHNLNPDEQKAVQDLYYQPRAMLAAFAMLFPDFSAAEKHLIEEREERERWAYFRKQFLLCHHRCHMIAEHLTQHVAAMTGQECPEGEWPALLILRALFADENKAAGDWENDTGATPPITWTPPNGGAFAALLGLAGTGLVAEYKPEGGAVVWRNLSGPLSGFGGERNKEKCPVPAVLPSMSATLTLQQMQFVSVHNGFLMQDATEAWLGGAQGFEVKWSGALLVEHEGAYEFWAGAPAPGDEKPDWEKAEHLKWRLILKRGQRTWVILSHYWPGEEEHRFSSLPLKRGAYELTVELIQPAPEFQSDEQVYRQHTGFQVKYSGPDTHAQRVEIPHNRLFAILKDQTLGSGITALSPGAASFLGRYYTSSLRDIRRTYQRAFKALLFAHRFDLSARRRSHGTSELGYMLAQKANFAGAAYYLKTGVFSLHLADFDFNFLPLLDDYLSPAQAQDERIHPSPQRIQAMFDWWERLFDYTMVRNDVYHRCDRHLWHLFEEAQEKQPAHPAYLLRHMGADSWHWDLDLSYYQAQNVLVYSVNSIDLEDDRWTVRAWHADQWIRALQCCFAAKEITMARPDLWASDDPGAPVYKEKVTGNDNLSAFLCDGCFENGEPRRYEDVKRLNDGLRERGRKALLAYLCHKNRVLLHWKKGQQFAKVPRDLSDLLLLDVEAGICEKASRIEEAITAVQSFVRRARLHLEPGWNINCEFARMWDREFATFHTWQACKRRHLYKENWIEWNDLERARGVEAFRWLESRLHSSELTIAAPGGLEWWPDERPPAHESLDLLQKSEPSEIQVLPTLREGLNLLGTPERAARPAWLAAAAANVPVNVTLNPAAGAGAAQLPFWMEAAISLGTRFYRVAAAGVPPAAMGFEPHERHNCKDCVSCCEDCGGNRPALVDEYYFWLIDGGFYEHPVTPPTPGFTPPPGGYQDGYQEDFYDPEQQQSSLWQDPNQLPTLLEWRPSPMVRLAWCRVHNGEFQQPRRSHQGVPVQHDTVNDLVFLGRTADSLTFSVSNALPRPGYADPSAPGFRYDLATDYAVVLPLITAPKSPPKFLNTLPAYPYFIFDAPGTHLFPLSPFSPSLAIARALRSHCRFEAALNWYRLAFDPLQNDCAWVHCAGDDQSVPPQNLPGSNTPGNANDGSANISPIDQTLAGVSAPCACCDSTNISCEQARNRSIILHYLETLLEWGDAVIRRGNSPEAFQQARVIFDAAGLILGRTPYNVRLHKPAALQTVSTFKPDFAPLNPRLLDLYETVRDRLGLIHSCLNWRRLHNGRPNCEMPYFGNSPVREGWRTTIEPCAEETEWCYLHSPYRFMFLIQKAQEYASRVQELGGALLAAFEKGDAEYLASLRAGHERELLTLGLEARKDQWRDADWQIEVLQKTKAVSQANLIYYNGLINAGPGGLINGEIQYENLISASLSLRSAANTTEAIGEAMRMIPDIVLGAAGFGGSPVAISWIPLGTKIGEALEAVARIINNCAEIDSVNAQLDETEAGWQRRLDEWTHQTQVLAIEIQQIERQILGSQRRRAQALQELDSHRRQMEQSAEVQNFLRDKFTAHDLYLFLQKETTALYHKTYDLALYAARQAEHAFNLERGYTARRFLPECSWESLHEGLLAGERLSAALRHMEKSYLDENVREYELTKHFSLCLHFPMEFLRLRTTGCCEIDIPEWMFDLDFPGHYMRRIKSVTLMIPCVTGPYTGVHCRMTLISSTTRIDPRLCPPPHDCCCPPEPCFCECCGDERAAREYEPCPDDPRVVRCYAARQAIATSSGQNDSGMFELNFHDERYLPFEYMGAVSRWRIELPPENNYFDMNTLSDCIIRLNYTAREGGDLLRRAANQAAHGHLPGDGWCFFDVRHEFPDAWQLFRDSCKDGGPAGRLSLRFDRKMFPFVPGARDVRISKMAILFATPEQDDCGCPKIEGCPCPEPGRPACRIVEFNRGREEGGDDRDREELIVSCLASEKWPEFYCGLFEAGVGPLDRNGNCSEVEFRFPCGTGKVERIFLLCRYELKSCAEKGHDKSR
jgi:hypothetical protein